MNFNMHFLVLDILFWPKYANILKLIKIFIIIIAIILIC